MRAVVYATGERFWNLRTDYPEPASPPPPGHALVKVIDVSINPVDFKKHDIPVVGRSFRDRPVGIDFSGVVLDAGDTDLQVGEAVFGASDGALAERILVKASGVARKPESVPHHMACTLFVAGLTSLQALKIGKLTPGGKVLLIGASGGTGGFGVQIAKALGASEICGVCSSRSADYVKTLGATEIHDYTGETSVPTSKAGHFDVVYDTVSSPDPSDHEYYPEAAPLLRPGGQYVAINGSTTRWVRALFSKFLFNIQQKNYTLFLADANRPDLEELMGMVESGKVVPQIDTQVDMTEEGVEKAFARQKSRRARGKIIIHVQDE